VFARSGRAGPGRRSIAAMSTPNLFEPEWEHEMSEPFSLRAMRVAHRAGAQRLGGTLYEIDPGGAISPYHVHHANEEMLVVLAGEPALRTPDGTRTLRPGDVVAFLAGPEGAHRVSNHGDTPARVLMISTMVTPEVAEHLDTGATLAMTGQAEGRIFPHGTGIDVMEALMKGMAAATERDPDAG